MSIELFNCLKEIEDLATVNGFSSEEVYLLRMLKIIELGKQDYKSMLDYFIRRRNNETNR